MRRKVRIFRKRSAKGSDPFALRFLNILKIPNRIYMCLVTCKLMCYNDENLPQKFSAKEYISPKGQERCEKVDEINAWKKEKNAVILAHYYVSPEVQDIADYIGDSFYLSKVAVGLKEQTIVFCGVSFMGESAKILNPKKTVLMPDMSADCAMAHMADEETIKRVRAEYDDLAVVCYINSTAELKELSDVCVTSANAVKIVKALPNQNIFFSQIT